MSQLFYRLLMSTIPLLSAVCVASEEVVAKIGDVAIKSEEIREIISGLSPEQQRKLREEPQAFGQYVRALLVQRLVLKEAEEKKWDQNPEVIVELVRARESALTESFLKAQAVPEQAYPTPAEVKQAYDDNKEKWVLPLALRLSQIFIASDQKKLDAVVKRLNAKPADFAAIAREFSEESTTAVRGGELGWLTEEQIQPEIRSQLPKWQVDALSAPIKLNDGWHILKILDVRAAQTLTLDQVKEDLVAELRAQKSQQLRQDYLNALIKQHPVAINEIALEALHRTDPPAQK